MKIAAGVIVGIIGVVGFSGWLAYVPDGAGDITTMVVAILPAALIGIGVFVTADGIAQANGLPPYDKKSA